MIDDLPEYMFHKKKANITPMSVAELFSHAEAPEEMRIWARILVKEGWSFFVVNQRRGRCYYKEKTITIPTWVLRNCKSEQRWYISHEMAHAHAGRKYGYSDSHGPNFMELLKEICPINDQQWEYTYKPRNAASAGVAQIGAL